MEVTLRHLLKKSNIYINSETGTGKTLSILCSVLAFKKQYPKQFKKIIYCSRTH